jgi:hypothetical protein
MANVCGTSLHVCRIRATRLDDVGNVAEPPNNVAVSDSPISVTVTPRVEAGADLTLKGGCDCIVATYLGPDLLKGFDLELAKAKIEPALEEILLGATVISDGGDQIGYWHPGPLDCGQTQTLAGFEFWTDVWIGSAQESVRPYIHHVYPSTTWQQAAQTFQNEFAQPGITGKASANPAWGNGPHGDQPEPIPADSPGGLYYTAEPLPDSACGYDDVTPAS